MAVFAPESPKFLLSRLNYKKLEDCLTRIAKINGTYEEEHIKKSIRLLSRQAETDQTILLEEQDEIERINKSASIGSLISNNVLRKNLIAVTFLWAS